MRTLAFIACFSISLAGVVACSGFSSSSDGSGTDSDAATMLDGPGIGGDAGPVESGVNDDAGATADAAVISCSPGANKRVFVSSEKHNGAFGGLEGADAFCQKLANAVKGLGGTWKAYVSTEAEAAATRMTTCDRYRMDGVTPGLTYSGGTYLQNGTVIDTNEGDSPVNHDDIIWRGSRKVGADCAGWLSGTMDMSGNSATVAYGLDADGKDRSCDSILRVLCFEQ